MHQPASKTKPKSNSTGSQLTPKKFQDYVDQHLVNQIPKLGHIWRFAVGWLALITILVFVLISQMRSLESYYTSLVAKPGGIYVEGIVGSLTNVNPIYASTAADKAASRLLFAGLLKYDVNNRLVTDLAQSITSDDKASRYTISLRQDLYWHDGRPLVAEDVVFTVGVIQNPKAKSPLQYSLAGVTVEATDKRTVVFSLPASFSPFPNLLTFGLLPSHILSQYPAEQLRSLAFNSSEAIGSGPFKLQQLVNVNDDDKRELKLQLIANPDYYAGRPLLDGFSLWVVPTAERLLELLEADQLTGVSGLDQQLLANQGLNLNHQVFDLTNGVYLFFKNTNPLLAEPELRRALAQAINVSQLLDQLDYPVQTISGPLLPEQLGYDADQTSLGFNPQQAKLELQELGWQLGSDGVRLKDERRLSLLLTTQKGTDYERLAQTIVKQLAQVGVEAAVDLRDSDGFAKSILQDHAYSDLLLYGLNLGADPDVYAFWHSSQVAFNSPVRRNLAEYQSEAADEALEIGRSRVEVELRTKGYLAFQEVWQTDLPALALYRPKFTYYETDHVRGPRGTILVDPLDRFRDVHLWTVLTTRVEVGQ